MGRPRKPGAGGPPSEARYRIQAVAEKTGVAAATLRGWERRYGIPAPARTGSAYRLYSDHDIELVRRLHQHCVAGMAPAEAARLVLAAARADALDGPGAAQDPFQIAVRRIVEAVERFDPVGVEQELAQATALGSAAAIFDRVVAPVQRHIGERWHAGTLSVAHEHLASEHLAGTARSLLRLVQPTDAERMVLLACVDEEQHSIPLYGVALRFASWGYRTVVLGSRTPPDALAAARRSMKPQLVGLSVTMPPKGARALFKAYAEACGSLPWVVGGAGARPLTGLIEAAGGVVVAEPSLAGMRERFELLLSPGRSAP